jgi:type IV pilus assembly protein PilW
MRKIHGNAGTGAMRGFSIIELMVAMLISLLLLAGVIAIFSSTKSSYETSDKVSRIQENGRFALDQFTYDIRSAGFVGCSRAANYISTSLNNKADLLWNFLDGGPVQGFQYDKSSTWKPALPTGIFPTGVDAPSDNSDILVLRMPARESLPLKVTTDMATATDALTVAAVADAFKAGDIAMAYSCEAQAFFQVTDYAGGILSHEQGGSSPGNANGSLSYTFRANAQVVPVNTVIYYVAQSTAGARATSLYRKIGTAAPEELVEGVEQMQVDYGVANGSGLVDTYMTADKVTNWQKVYTVRVALLVRSIEPYGGEKDTRQYTLLGGDDVVTVAAPNDRYYREVFASTVGIRNKVVIN